VDDFLRQLNLVLLRSICTAVQVESTAGGRGVALGRVLAASSLAWSRLDRE
jgi:hypothetical protein